MKTLNIALIGSPNSGKTTIFNLIAGTRYHVANYAGVTVERKYASFTHNQQDIVLHDLPGLYSFGSYSPDERITRNFLVDERPDFVVQVVDASNLVRALYLSVQIIELGFPLIIALNMMDMAEKRGQKIDIKRLSRNLGVPVVAMVARSGVGTTELLDAITGYEKKASMPSLSSFSYGADIDLAIDKLIGQNDEASVGIASIRWKILSYFDGSLTNPEDNLGETLYLAAKKEAARLEKHFAETLQADTTGLIADHRYGIAKYVMTDVISLLDDNSRLTTSDTIDKVVLHKLLGPFLLALSLYGLYSVVFWASEYPAGWLKSFFGVLSKLVESTIPGGFLRSLLVSGIIDGVGGVLGFTPLIFFMFICIGALEDSGYLPRIAFILDRLFRWFGLQGNSVLPYIVSGGIAGGCAVPGVMAARTIKGRRERILTILTAPFMPCGAKLPVFALLVAAFFPGNKGMIMLLITLISWLFALFAAKIYSITVLRGETSAFIMELPPYRLPTARGLLIHAWDRTWMYIKKAGTIILAASIIIWSVMSFPTISADEGKSFDELLQRAKSAYSQDIVAKVEKSKSVEGLTPQAKELKAKMTEIENQKAQVALRSSYAGQLGTMLEPISRYAGFDWRTNVALVAGFAAKEIVVSTMGTAYSLGQTDPEESVSLADRLHQDPGWSAAAGMALIIFTILYAPCVVTIVAIVRETRSIGWGLFTMVANTSFAYLFAVLVFQVLRHIL